MEKTYGKLTGNSWKWSTLGRLSDYFGNCFKKSSGSLSFVVVVVEDVRKITPVIPWATNLNLRFAHLRPGAHVGLVASLWSCPSHRAGGAVPGAERRLPARGPATGVSCEHVWGLWSCCPAQRFLQPFWREIRAFSIQAGWQKAGLIAEYYMKFSERARGQQWSYEWGQGEMRAVSGRLLVEIVTRGDANTEYRIIWPFIRFSLEEILYI